MRTRGRPFRAESSQATGERYRAETPQPVVNDPALIAIPLSAPEIMSLQSVMSDYQQALQAVETLKKEIARRQYATCECGTVIPTDIEDNVDLETLQADLASAKVGISSVVRRISGGGRGATLWFGE